MYYNVTLRHVPATSVAGEIKSVLHILRVCLEPLISRMQCVWAILHRHLSPARLYKLFPRYLINCVI